MIIGLCGNIPLQALANELDKTIGDNDIVVGRPGVYIEELGENGFKKLDLCIIALHWERLFRELYEFTPGDSSVPILSGFQKTCNELRAVIEDHRKVNSTKFLIFSPISGTRSSTGFLNRLLNPSPSEIFSECQKIFNEMCRSVNDVYPVDMEELSAETGKENAFDADNLYRLEQPFSDLMISKTAQHISQIIVQIVKYPLKCLVLDLDNTLWGGVIGEEGMENIVLGDHGPGLAFKNFQRTIYNLYKQGVILAVCSKNNTCDALEALELHSHMVIHPQMISSFRINWEDKPSNVLGISEELKIGLDSMMFIDDDPSGTSADEGCIA